ncbi:MAG: glycosyl hydrolase family 32 [Sedimentisphaeraceae bacterium JB056]
MRKTLLAILIFLPVVTAEMSRQNDKMASIIYRGDCNVITFEVGANIFTNRDYAVSECPESLKGLQMLVDTIDSSFIRIKEDGMLVVLTPYKDAQYGSCADSLQGLGFGRIEIPPFQLFGDKDWNRVSAFKKNVKKGENYRLGKYVVVLGFCDAEKMEDKPWSVNSGELLYNGIRLPEIWPPCNIDPVADEPMPVPYLNDPPKLINIDIGRQLFVDDFLIESTDLRRSYHKPEKYKGNPILEPKTKLEINAVRSVPYYNGYPGNAVAAPKSGGIWWDPEQQLFKMWYEAGWIGTIAYATSRDGINWDRPELDIVPGTNQVLPTDLTADSWTVFPNPDAENSEEKWTLFMRPPGGTMPGWSLTSPDGIHWTKRIETGLTGDRSTHFYNPFRKKWVYSLRTSFSGKGRARDYYECDDFLKGAKWSNSQKVPWLMTDRLDPRDYLTGREPQLYNFDAVAYESIMLGFFEIHHGPPNDKCDEAGLPKITELMFAYSRDGFHWSRPDRRAHISAERKDVWDRGYVQSVGNICTVRGDKLWFYYSGFRGDASNPNGIWIQTGMYDNGSTGVAFMRRDGFVSLDAGDKKGSILTRPLKFPGDYLFINAVSSGCIRAEVRDLDGNAIEPFTIENSIAFSGDSTIAQMKWKDGKSLSALAGKPVKFYFELTNGSLYSFWVSSDQNGRSDGFVAGGGPGYTGLTDTVGKVAIDKEQEFAPDIND